MSIATGMVTDYVIEYDLANEVLVGKSSQIAGMRFNVETRRLFVRFTSLDVYVYENVEDETIKSFGMSHEDSELSIGKLFNALIKTAPDKYPYLKIKDKNDV